MAVMSTAQKNIAANESIRKLIEKNDEMKANVETLTKLYKNLKKREAVVLQVACHTLCIQVF